MDRMPFTEKMPGQLHYNTLGPPCYHKTLNQ